MRILVVEDNTLLGDGIQAGLRQQGFTVDWVQDGVAASLAIENEPYSAIVLDLGLPRRSGLEVLKQMRLARNPVPVLILTARDAIEERVTGLDAGADDYLVKPFAFQELLARIRALLRRGGELKSSRLQVGDLTLDTITHRAERGGQAIELSAREYALIEFLMRHPGQALSRTQIAEHVWNYDFYATSNVVDVYIRYLRRKIDAGFELQLIQTVRGVGYKIEAEP